MFSQSMFWKLFLPIGMVLIASAIATALYLPFVIRNNAEQDAVAAGKETVSQFIKLRQYYTENVISKINGKAGLTVAANHQHDPNAVPLPATMIHELSDMFDTSGMSLKLYSPYPFPNRQGRILDKFGQDAWNYLQQNPDKVFYRTESLGDRTMVRVAIADRMTAQACVSCHNTTTGSPKTDWRLGDVRGILEVDSSKQLDSGHYVLTRVLVTLGVILLLIAAFLRFAYQRSIARPMHDALQIAHALTEGNAEKISGIEAIADGNLDKQLALTVLPKLETGSIANDEAGKLLQSVISMGATQMSFDMAFAKMRSTLRDNREAEETRDWIKSGQNELNALMRGEHETTYLAKKILSFLIARTGASCGALYLYNPDLQELQLSASHALADEQQLRARFALGEGLVGQSALERNTLHMTDLPVNYMPIVSALGQAKTLNLMVIPLIHADNLIGVLEIAAYRNYSASQLEFLQLAKEGIAIGLGVALSRKRTQELLEQATQQAEELRVQQEQLQQSNEELEERAQMLEQQRELIRVKSQEVESSNAQLQRKAEELERTSTYKSEFLANMSHELRTPLNSMLILSSLLRDNKEGKLSERQVEYAATIHGAGKDLLNLINDILDLSKIEAGRLELNLAETSVSGLIDELHNLFLPLAEKQHLDFLLNVQADVPATLLTDSQRTQQILKNLLANAFKFTTHGQIKLNIHYSAAASNTLKRAAIAFAVSDSGIGIAADKQGQIFHAFQQADGSTSRKYGGTGLGLSISRQLAQRMGGDITLSSASGKGSIFTLLLPIIASETELTAATMPEKISLPAALPTPAILPETVNTVIAPIQPVNIQDDRDLARPNMRSILIVEDDAAFATILRDTVRDHGFHALVATDGESGLEMAGEYLPNAIILDIMLPHIDGWGVMRNIKDNPRTRHIPVHFITCLEDRQKALNMGAIGFITKPVDSAQLDAALALIASAIDKTLKKLLIVEDDLIEARSIAALLEIGGLEIVLASSGKEALQYMQQEKFDCMVLDLGLSDMSGFELLDHLQEQNQGTRLPVIIHSGRSLSAADERRLQNYADSIIIKGAQSPERLLNEVSLFLHLVENSLPQEKQKMIRRALDKEAMFEQRKVLLVDDDMRNIFSLSSILSEKGMHIVEATNGLEALAQLETHHDIDIVLMDIMMPEMDGYEAMRRIRKNQRLTHLPIIAMTAKAMVGDQKLCLEAGASDYISKPIDLDKLYSLMRVWLYQA